LLKETDRRAMNSKQILGATVTIGSLDDVTSDNQNRYLYDGEGRVCAVKSVMFGTLTGYVYGADGTRVSTGTITPAEWASGSCDPSLNGFQPGNVAASRTGKNVPATSSANVPGPPLKGDVAIDNPVGLAALGPQSARTWNAAAWAVSPQGIVTWYGASAVGAVGALGVGATVSTVGSMGTAEIAVGPGFEASSGAHFALGVEGEWMQGLAVGDEPMAMTGRLAQWFAGRATSTVVSVPVLFPEAVLPAEVELVGNCFTGVCSVIARGWGLWP
jgi:hypothetical protein